MKTIGLLGGTGWSSTIGYYKILNELVGERLGGYHSANILLKSIDYHEIMTNYGVDDKKAIVVFKEELKGLINLKPDCIIICCNSLHKYYDLIKNELASSILVFHAIELVADHLVKNKQQKALLLATKFTLEDGFFAKILQQRGVEVVIPNQEERNKMKNIHDELMNNIVTQSSRDYFASLTKKYSACGTVILGCTEYPMVLDKTNSNLPIIDPVVLQATHAVDYALKVQVNDKIRDKKVSGRGCC